jgi:phosphate transport system permease protein
VSPALPILIAIGLGFVGWFAARARARTLRLAAPRGTMRALPVYHGWYVALWILLPTVIFVVVWAAVSPGLVTQEVLQVPAAARLPELGFTRDTILAQARAVATGAAPGVFDPLAREFIEPYRAAMGKYNLIGALVTIILGFAGGAWAFLRVRPDFAARSKVERAVMGVLLAASLVAIVTTFGIVISLLFETIRFFGMVNPLTFLFGTHWSPDPMSAVGPETSSNYGALPLFWGTIFIGAIIAMIVAIPLGLMSAIYLTQYAHSEVRKWMKPILEILAGVPTVVYGYFAALIVAPLIRDFAFSLGIPGASTESALAAGLVMGIMIIPFVSSMADDSIAAVPRAMRDGSLALGATKAETIRGVLVPAALPGIVAGVMLAVSRAIGETMIVVMAAGASARLSANPFSSMTTVTYQIVAMLTGEGNFDHPATLGAFALGMVLFIVTLILNAIALVVVRRYREAYE